MESVVVQIGINVNEAKVFKALATPLGLCGNLTNALKLLANQQKDGDSPIESIVTACTKEAEDASWTGKDGLSKRITVVPWTWVILRQGTRSLEVQKPNFSEAFREGADEPTLRADEVGTLSSRQTTLSLKDGERRLMGRACLLPSNLQRK